MNEIQTFNFKTFGVRTFVDENGNPWFCAKDVCDILGYKRSRDAIDQHTKSEGVVKHRLVKTLSNGRQQKFEMIFIDERNVYRLVMRSNMPDAEPFQDWVCGEVLPTIRKTGSYGTPKPPALPSYSEALRQLADELDKNQKLLEQAKTNAPKVEFSDAVVASDTEMTITAAAKTLGIGPRKFFDWLRLNGFLYKQSNQATQDSINRGFMVVRFATINHTDGIENKPYPHITGAGLFYFYGRLRKENLIQKNEQLELVA